MYNKLQYVLDVEEDLKAQGRSWCLFELNFFIYDYLVGVSRIAHEGKEYLCFRCGSHIYQYDASAMTEKEQEMYEEEYHVYLLEEDIPFVEDKQLKEKIVAIFLKCEEESGAGILCLKDDLIFDDSEILP